MSTTNIADFGVSFIDADGVYNGGVNGVKGGNVNRYTSDGEISTSDELSIIISSQMTLGNGLIIGQRLSIYAEDTTTTTDVDFIYDGGTPVTATFTPAGEYAELIWTGTGWIVYDYTCEIA